MLPKVCIHPTTHDFHQKKTKHYQNFENNTLFKIKITFIVFSLDSFGKMITVIPFCIEKLHI